MALSSAAKIVIEIAIAIVVIALILLIIRLIVLGPYYRKKNRIDGKVVIVTGCNTGIGKQTVLELAKRGGRIYMACRDSTKCEQARLEIVEKSKNPNVFNRTLDLSSLASIKQFADKFLEEESRLDILINNAGIAFAPKSYTKDGFEEHFGVNHLGHFYLTNLLLDILKRSAPSRIVVVSSSLYAIGQIRKDDLNYEKSYSKYHAYGDSKLANLLFALKLSKMLEGTGVTVNSLHPGAVATDGQRYILQNNTNTRKLITPIMNFFFKPPKCGAQTSIRLAIDPALEGVSGKSYFDCYYTFFLLSKARDSEMADWLWNASEEMVGLKNSKPAYTNTVDINIRGQNTQE